MIGVTTFNKTLDRVGVCYKINILYNTSLDIPSRFFTVTIFNEVCS